MNYDILYFNASLGFGGLEKSFIDLTNALCEENNIVLEVLLFEGNKIEKHLNHNKIKVIIVKKFTRFNLFGYFQLLKILKKRIVHTHGSKATEIVYYISKIIDFIHVGTKHNTRKGNVFNKIENVTTVSLQARKTIKNKNVKIIYNGIPYVKSNKLNNTSVHFKILAIGRLDKIKGFDILIKELSKVNENFVLEIIGEGKEKDNLSKEIEEYKLTQKVKLIGFKNDVTKYISDSDLVVISSHSEGFSLVAIESLIYGKTLISRKVGICEEILDNNFLIEDFNFSEKIIEIINNKEEYIKMFDELKDEKKDLFFMKNIISQYIKYYKNLIS